MKFIFMLTHNDRTVADALEVYERLRDTDLELVGCKDVGVDDATLRELTRRAQADGRQVMLEVVSLSEADELCSIEAAVAAGVDYVVGGTHAMAAANLIANSAVQYFPFPGRIVGHPSELVGSIDEIADSACELTQMPYVHGVDLLAYRHKSADAIELARAVVAASAGPVVVAGSIERAEQIAALREAGVWGFTIGSAIFDGRIPGGPDVVAQTEWALEVSA